MNFDSPPTASPHRVARAPSISFLLSSACHAGYHLIHPIVVYPSKSLINWSDLVFLFILGNLKPGFQSKRNLMASLISWGSFFSSPVWLRMSPYSQVKWDVDFSWVYNSFELNYVYKGVICFDDKTRITTVKQFNFEVTFYSSHLIFTVRYSGIRQTFCMLWVNILLWLKEILPNSCHKPSKAFPGSLFSASQRRETLGTRLT